MPTKAARLVKRLRDQALEWIRAPATAVQYERAERTAKDFSQGKSVVMTSTFEVLGSHHLARGVDAVLAGNAATGWVGIDLGFQLHAASARLGGSRLMERLAPVLAHAVVADREAEAEGLAARLLKLYKDDAALPDPVAELHPFVRLTVALWQLKTGAAPAGGDLGPYRPTWEALTGGSPEALARELEGVADRHLAQARELGSNEPEFIMGYELLPVDVLWLLRAREKLRLPAPTSLSHPLMSLPTGSPPSPWPRAQASGSLGDALRKASTLFGREEQ